MLYSPAKNVGQLSVLGEPGGSRGRAPSICTKSYSFCRRKRTVVSAPLHTCFRLVPETHGFRESFKECLVLEWHKFREISKSRPETVLPFRRWRLFGELAVWRWACKQAHCFLMLQPEKGIVIRSDVIVLLACNFCSCHSWTWGFCLYSEDVLCLPNEFVSERGLVEGQGRKWSWGQNPPSYRKETLGLCWH